MEIRSPENAQEWESYFSLRYEVLRKPWNQPLGTERDGLEDQAKHFACFSASKIIGVGRLDQVSSEVFQIRYMAVHPDAQNKGIGRMIIREMEAEAWLNGAETILLHARENAMGFYESLGYELQSISHLLFGTIQHFLMQKKKG